MVGYLIKVNNRLDTMIPLLVTVNLTINTLSTMCSYADYRRRLFPFLRWTQLAPGDSKAKQRYRVTQHILILPNVVAEAPASVSESVKEQALDGMTFERNTELPKV